MTYILEFSKQASKDIDLHKKSGNKVVLKKLLVLLQELTQDPYKGTGKPEALKHELSGYWSRRINQEHRIVYQVLDSSVRIHSAFGHY
jgi:toxin YoeB